MAATPAHLPRAARRGAAATLALGVALGLGLGLGATPAAAATPAVGLGTGESWAVFAGSAVSNTGPSVVSGNTGVSPGTAITGFPPGLVVGGSLHAADAEAAQARADLGNAHLDAAGRGPATPVATELGGRTLTPGVHAGATLEITGALTLDAQGDPSAVFVLQASSTLVTSTASSVRLVGGASGCNVVWSVGSSATLGAGSSMVGTVLADQSISTGTGTVVLGRLAALTGAVTLDSTSVTRPDCAAAPGTTVPSTPAAPSPGATPTADGPVATSPAPAATASDPAGPDATAGSTTGAGSGGTGGPAGAGARARADGASGLDGADGASSGSGGSGSGLAETGVEVGPVLGLGLGSLLLGVAAVGWSGRARSGRHRR